MIYEHMRKSFRLTDNILYTASNISRQACRREWRATASRQSTYWRTGHEGLRKPDERLLAFWRTLRQTLTSAGQGN